MGRVLKWLGIGLLVLIIVVAIGIGAIYLLVDPNDYRGRIEQAVTEQTGRQLTIEGDIDLSLFPALGLSLGTTRLADSPKFGDEPFVSLDNATLAVEVMPLLSGELRLDTIILHKPQIRLIRNENGKANWQTLSSNGGSPSSGGNAGAAAIPAILRDATLAGLRIDQATLRYVDRQAGTDVTLQPFNLKLEEVALGEPITVTADGRIEVADGPNLQIDISGNAVLKRDFSTASFSDLDITATASNLGTPPGKQSMDLQAAIQANLETGVIRVNDVIASVADAEVTGNAVVESADAGTQATGSLQIPELNPREVMQALAIEPPKTRDDEALTRFTGDVAFRYQGGQLELQPIEMSLDQTQLSGNALVRNFTAPALDFQLQAGQLNADRYLPPAGEGGGDATIPAGELPEGEAPPIGKVPMEALRRLDLNGQLQVDALTVSGVKTSNVVVTVRAKDGKIKVNPLTAQLYGGRYEGDMRLDATGEELAVSVDDELSGIQAQPLLNKLAGISRLLGRGGISLQGSARGADLLSLLQGVDAEAVFEFVDGAVEGINLAAMLRRGMATLRGGSAAQADAQQRTDFSSLTGRLQINGTKIRSDKLNVKTPLLRLEGSGNADVLSQELDYNLDINVVGTLAGQGGQELDKLQGITIPLRITGSFSDPSFSLALAKALQGQATEKLKEKAEQRLRAQQDKAKAKLEEKKGELEEKLKENKGEIQKKLQEKLGDEASDKLKGLFN